MVLGFGFGVCCDWLLWQKRCLDIVIVSVNLTLGEIVLFVMCFRFVGFWVRFIYCLFRLLVVNLLFGFYIWWFVCFGILD